MSSEPLRIFLVAGEASGDALGGRLMAALSAHADRPVEFRGVGGDTMTLAGLNSLFPMSELSVMGVSEVLPKARALFRRMRQAADAAHGFRAHAIVTIDAPAFAHGFVKRLPDHATPRIHYVAPTVWAWRPWRVHKFRRHFDRILTLLPFEPPYFERVGLAATFVGHPVLECGADRADGGAFRRAHGISDQAPLAVVLLGSRRGEVGQLAGPVSDGVKRLAATHPELRVAVPTVPHLADAVRAIVADWPGRPTVTTDPGEKYAAMAAAEAAVAASGTVSLELAMAGVPAVIVYKVTPITAMAVRLLVRVKYANLVNLVLDRPAVPELLQGACTGERIAAELSSLLDDPERAQAIRGAQHDAIEHLRAAGEAPSVRAAKAVLAAIGQGRGLAQIVRPTL